MQRSIPNNSKRPPYSFWISLLLHAILIATLILLYLLNPKPTQEYQATPNQTQQAVPAYTYTPPTPNKATIAPQKQQNQQQSAKDTETTPNDTATQQSPIETVTPAPSHFSKQSSARPKSLFAASMAALSQTQLNTLRAPRDEDPVYIVGDQNGVSDPLIQLLGKALSAHFSYPKTAGELGMHGRVLIGMTLNPDGQLSDIEIVASSNSEELDKAALYAVNSAPIVKYADRFISRPKHFVIGFIFSIIH